mmetsp:Transcript_4170/g.5368  ORF Transcript_4170/g.5368 Transcript_4170/m.5368 type:complete len:93 (+) Transcript_4170:54-332(+)
MKAKRAHGRRNKYKEKNTDKMQRLYSEQARSNKMVNFTEYHKNANITTENHDQADALCAIVTRNNSRYKYYNKNFAATRVSFINADVISDCI